MTIDSLEELAKSLNLTIKIQIREVLGLKFFRIVVARITNNYVKIFGEIKGWTIPNKNGLQLDTLRILRDSPEYVSELIWATAMAWALEQTICENATLLAIYDEDGYSKKLVRYFRLIGFTVVKEVGSSPSDLLLRLIWGGAGTLMKGNCKKILNKLDDKFKNLNLLYPA
tara:strand:- start:1090 stop:1599 length:510 start_codon:yes stop_codon:yes gene_type:complete